MTIDGFCDHTAVDPDDEIHQHYADLLDSADLVLYGRTTYQLMQFWQGLAKNPSGEKFMDDFALSMDRIRKIVFSHTLTATDWDTATIADRPIEEIVPTLKLEAGGDILVGSPSLIVQLMNLNLIDEYQLCVHPVVAGSGLPLFRDIKERSLLKLCRTKTFDAGAIILYYEPASNRPAGTL